MAFSFANGFTTALAPSRGSVRFLLALAVVSILVLQTAIWFLGRAYNPLVSVENGPMEIFQAGAMLVGWFFLAWTASQVDSLSHRVLLSGLALFYLTFVFGEIDTRVFASPLLELVFDGAVRDLLFGLLWAGAVLLFFRHRRPTWICFRQWLPSAGGLLLLIAGAFWLASGAVDKLHLFAGTHHFFEELAEVNAAMLMLMAAVHTTFFWARGHGHFPPAD
jgi:hypothetical protein